MGLVISCLSILKGLFCKCFPGARSQVLPSSHPLSQVSQDSASIDTDVAATSVRHQSPPFQRPIRAQYGELVTGLSVSKDAATKALDTAFRVPRFLTVFGLLEEVNAALATLEYHREKYALLHHQIEVVSHAAQDSWNPEDEARVGSTVDRFAAFLTEICSSMNHWSCLDRLQSFANQLTIAGDVEAKLDCLDAFSAEFNIPTSSERAWGREFSIAKGQDADTLSDELRANETPDTYNIAFSKLADKILDELQILLRHQPLGFDCSLLSARILDTLQPNASTLSTDKTSGVEIEHGLPIESAEQPPAASNESKLDLPNQRDKVTTLPEMEAPTSPQFSLASELLKSLARKHEHTFFPFYGKQLELLRICGHKSLRALQENSDLGDQSRESSLTALISILQSVESRTDYIADLDSFECLIHQPTIEANLETELSSLQALELVTQTRAHEWSEDLAATRKNDRDFIVDMIRSQPEMESLDPARRKLLDERLKELQEKLKSNTAGPGSLDLDDRRMELFALHSLFDVTLPHAELRLGVEYTDETQVSSDKNWDVWEATWLGQQKVMLSVRRGSYRVLGKKDRQLVRREVYIRRQLHSSYILPLYGICSEPERPPFRVSPWCKNGTAVDYLREKPTGQAFKICLEAAYGLRYLHSFDKPIVLGGMKGETIYISDQGSALLAGFELSDHEGGTFDSSMVSRGQWAPWIAPELVASSLKGTKAQLTRPCDIWTWAVATLELMSKQSISDFDDSADQAAIVEHGQHLDLDKFKLPSESESELRPLLEECWQLKPEMRLDITQVVMRMEVAWRIFSLFDR